MSSYGNPPQDPDQPGQPGDNPYGQQPAYGQGDNPYGQPAANPYGAPPAYGQPGEQGAYGYGAPAGQTAYAGWPKRVGAAIIDGLLIVLAMIPYYIGTAMAAGSMTSTTDPVTGAPSLEADGGSAVGVILMVIGIALAIGVFVWNTCLKQGRTGYSVGKGILGIKLIKEETGQPIGAGMSFVRYIAHILDQLPCYIGYLWPLWDSKRQTFADKVTGTVVIEQPQP